MQTPTKRSLSFGSPSSSRSPSESKKTTVVGYVLDTSVVMKGFYFYVQLQDSETNVVQIPVYNAKIHQTISNFEASGDPVKLEVYKQEDGKLKVGSYSHVYPASPRDITFSINSSLKETIQLEKASRKISVKDLRRINARINKEKFTLKGRINLGPDEPREIDTQYGTKMIKKDIEVEDITGKIDFHLFSNRLEEIQHGSSYELTSLLLSDYGGTHVSTTRDSTITLIEPLKGLPPPVLKPSSRTTYTIDGFESFTNERLFIYCKKCHKEIPIEDAQKKADWMTCPAFKCGTRNKTKGLSVFGACDVNFAANKDEYLWVAVLPRILAKILNKDVTDVKQITDAIENVGECEITVERGVLEEIRFEKDNEVPPTDTIVTMDTTITDPSGEKKVTTVQELDKNTDAIENAGESQITVEKGDNEPGELDTTITNPSIEKEVTTIQELGKDLSGTSGEDSRNGISGKGRKVGQKFKRFIDDDTDVKQITDAIENVGESEITSEKGLPEETTAATNPSCEKKVTAVQELNKDLSGCPGGISRNGNNGKGRKVGQKHKLIN